jgi:demethoxyubiquinone hydroxylase (CLK1/Coq7/Cat5 family)
LALVAADQEVLAAVQSIQADEQAHEAHAALSGGKASGAYSILWYLVTGATSFAIWLSTRL